MCHGTDPYIYKRISLNEILIDPLTRYTLLNGASEKSLAMDRYGLAPSGSARDWILKKALMTFLAQ